VHILLVNPPCRTPSLIPLGLGYVASVLRQEGHNVSLMDFNVSKKPYEAIERELETVDCDAIGIGGLTTTYDFVKKFSNIAKKVKPNVMMIAGNMVSTSSPELLLRHSQIDICVIDEGEETIRELMQRIKDFPEIDSVKGIVFKKGNRIVSTAPRERIKDLDRIPFPAWDLFQMETYINNPIHTEYGRRSMNISTVRGCPFQCIYCSRPFGPRVYKRSPASIVAEIKELKRCYNIEFIGFTDDLFTIDRSWVEEFCDALIKEKLKIGWGASARVNLVDLNLLKKMKKAGCEALSYGFESGSQRMLDSIKKGVRVEQAEKAVEFTRKAGIGIEGSFMIGMIGETEESVNETVEFIKRTGLTLHRFFYTTPYPNTPLYEMAKEMRKIPDDENKYVSSLGEMYNTLLVNLTTMSDKELKSLKERAEAKIRENFSLRSRIEIATEESKRIFEDLKKRIKAEGAMKTFGWSLGKVKEKIGVE